MPIDETGLTTVIKVGITANITIDVATYKRVVEDAAYFLNEMIKPDLSTLDQNRYARMNLLLMALYIESLSNALLESSRTRNLQGLKKQKGWKEYLKGFMSAYYKYYEKELHLNMDGIHDIFFIRNHFIAHPKGYTREKEDGSVIIKQEGKGGIGFYKKFKNFPYAYSKFNSSHAIIVVNEVVNFLKNYHNLIKRKTSEKKLLDSCWPAELIQWKKKNRV